MDILKLNELLRGNFRVAEVHVPHKYAKVYVDTKRLEGMLNGQLTTNLPKDCTIYSVGWSEDRWAMYLILHSESWEEVPEGQMIPEFCIIWTMKESYVWVDG